jgi:phosphohistidine phosphatase
MSTSAPEVAHRLVLLRHAKSAWPFGVPDHERPLAGKGRRNAQAAGQWFVSEGPRPDLVVVSDATRTQQTWDVVRGSFEVPPAAELEPRIYAASVEDVLEVIRETAPDVFTLCVVGHEPAMSETTLRLAGPDSEQAALDAVAGKFPTSAVAVLSMTCSWADLKPGSARLESFTVPRAEA